MDNYREEIKLIVSYYKNSIKQEKFKIFITLLKDYLLKLRVFVSLYLRFFKRTQKFTKDRYNRIWGVSDFINDFDVKNKKNILLHYYENLFFSSSSLTTKIQQFLIITKIKELNPHSVLEVGCGSGITLKLLSDIYEKIQFYGIDQSEVGIDFAKKFNNKRLDSIFTEPLNFDFKYLSKTNTKLEVQDAKKLNFTNQSFDLVFTNLALEQMDNIKLEVLSEIKRVSNKYIVLIEPFKNLNRFGIRYLHHKSKQYFNLNHKDLQDDKFEILDFYHELPALLSLNYGMLVLKRKN